MLKTNWSHVVAQNPPPHLASHPERFHHSLGSGEFHKANALVGEGVFGQPDLYFGGGKVTWKSIKLEWMAMNGWQPFIRDDLFHPNERMMENSWIFARVPRFTDGHLFEILASWNHLAVRWGTDPTALPSIHSPIFLPKLFGKILEIQTSISVGYGLWQLKHGVN